MASNRYGECSACLNSRRISGTYGLCESCTALMRVGHLIVDDSTETGWRLIDNAMSPIEAVKVLRKQVQERKSGNEAKHIARRDSSCFAPDREFSEFGITAAGESLGLGHNIEF